MQGYRPAWRTNEAGTEILMLLKQKFAVEIKGRWFADENKRWDHTSEEDLRSPTVSLDSMPLPCILYFMEFKYVATVNISGAFKQEDMDDDVSHPAKQEDSQIVDLSHTTCFYTPFICTVNGKTTIYLKLRYILFGTLLIWLHQD